MDGSPSGTADEEVEGGGKRRAERKGARLTPALLAAEELCATWRCPDNGVWGRSQADGAGALAVTTSRFSI